MNKTVIIAELADILNLSERRIYQLVEEKLIPKESKGRYELKTVIQSYIKYLQQLASSKGSSSEQKESKSRLLKAQADKAELELEALKGKYIETTEVEFEWSNLLLAFRSKMLNMPSKLASLLAGAGSDFAKLEQILEDEIYEALTELGKYGETEDPENSETSNTTRKA